MQLEQMVVEVQQVLPAPPDRVFALLSDVERMAGLGPEHVRSEWMGQQRGVGAVFVGSNQRGDLTWDVPCHVVEHVPPTRFAWTTGSRVLPSARWSYLLEPAPGGTLVSQRFQHGPGSTYLRRAVERHPERAADLIAGRAAELERNMRATLQAAAALL